MSTRTDRSARSNRRGDEYHSTFPGFTQVPAATAADAYVKSIEGAQTGRIYIVE